jgi:hypothetical protein
LWWETRKSKYFKVLRCFIKYSHNLGVDCSPESSMKPINLHETLVYTTFSLARDGCLKQGPASFSGSCTHIIFPCQDSYHL